VQATDEHRIMSHGVGRIDHNVQQLIIPGRREAEDLTDRLLLGAGVPPPLPLEVEDRCVPR